MTVKKSHVVSFAVNVPAGHRRNTRSADGKFAKGNAPPEPAVGSECPDCDAVVTKESLRHIPDGCWAEWCETCGTDHHEDGKCVDPDCTNA
jgi:hypothetical protein